MKPDTVFAAANGLAVVGWLVLAASPPRAPWRASGLRFAGVVLPLAFALAYAVLMATTAWPAGAGFGSIAQVRALFTVDALLTAGWLHYLAFDLFVGAWILRQGAESGVPHLLLLPLLAATFLFGPAGLLAFAVLRALRGVIARRTPSGVSP